MKTDSIFFEIFQTRPHLLFEVLGEPADRGEHYEFQSVELKQTAFRIDGVLTPKPGSPENTVIFVEFQFQKDEVLYERLFSEIMLYLAQYPTVEDWQAIAVYPRHSTEQPNTHKYRNLIQSEQFQAVYLEDFLEMSTEDIGIRLMQLIVSPKAQTDRYLQGMVQQFKNNTIPNQQAIIKLVSTIMVYKFPQLTREAIQAMFTVSELKQTRVYQDALQEGREKGREEGIELGREQALQEALAERLQRERTLFAEFLALKLGTLPIKLVDAIQHLSFEQLESLRQSLADFKQVADLESWLVQEGDRPTST